MRNKNYDCYGPMTCNLSSIVIGGLFFYALYRVCKDAYRSAIDDRDREIMKKLKEIEKNQKEK